MELWGLLVDICQTASDPHIRLSRRKTWRLLFRGLPGTKTDKKSLSLKSLAETLKELGSEKKRGIERHNGGRKDKSKSISAHTNSLNCVHTVHDCLPMANLPSVFAFFVLFFSCCHIEYTQKGGWWWSNLSVLHRPLAWLNGHKQEWELTMDEMTEAEETLKEVYNPNKEAPKERKLSTILYHVSTVVVCKHIHGNMHLQQTRKVHFTKVQAW